ncbi:MAG: hypothetical protein ACHQ9S_04350 [Candidatus Binatia bacterium]
MRREEYHADTEIDEYLWPLTGDIPSIQWESVTEELRIRQRLAEIVTHVREMHVRPRIRRLPDRIACTQARSIVESIITGPEGGPPWAQSLKEPVPRALRDEWNQLTQRLREINSSRLLPQRRTSL